MTDRSSPDSAPAMSEREEIINLIRNEYDPKPNLGLADYPDFDWDDGAGRIADAILSDKMLLLRKHADEIERLRAPAQAAPEAPGYRSGLTYGDGYKRGFDDARGAPQAAEERRCQKCGRETKGEEALVDGKILCHPCADDVPQASTDKTLAQALYEAECYGIGATSDTNQRVILQSAKELAALRARPQAASPELRTAAELIVSTFEKDEAQGYRSKDRQFAIDILKMALQADPAQPQEVGTTDVSVPAAALDWLFGAGPDAEGKWFGECEEDATPRGMIRARPQFWWRSKFRSMIPALTRPVRQMTDGDGK